MQNSFTRTLDRCRWLSTDTVNVIWDTFSRSTPLSCCRMHFHRERKCFASRVTTNSNVDTELCTKQPMCIDCWLCLALYFQRRWSRSLYDTEYVTKDTVLWLRQNSRPLLAMNSKSSYKCPILQIKNLFS